MSQGDTLFFLTDGVIVTPGDGIGLERLTTSLREAQVAASPGPPPSKN
ncbi:hypothetical protein ACF1GT_00185 [Streptomyces sp. NPDC014636]